MIKYLLLPGYVQSKYDGDVFLIGQTELVRLYGVDRRECVVPQYNGQRHIRGLIPLTPRLKGDYKEHLAELERKYNGQTEETKPSLAVRKLIIRKKFRKETNE